MRMQFGWSKLSSIVMFLQVMKLDRSVPCRYLYDLFFILFLFAIPSFEIDVIMTFVLIFFFLQMSSYLGHDNIMSLSGSSFAPWMKIVEFFSSWSRK